MYLLNNSGELGPVPSRTQGRLPDRARLWLGRRKFWAECPKETGHSYSPPLFEKIPFNHSEGKCTFITSLSQ